MTSDTDLMTIDAATGEVLPALALREVPTETLAAAQRAAAALQEVIRKKTKPVIFNGEQYLEFEDWQTVGRFYGVTTKVLSVAAVSLAETHGFHAVAVAQLADGREVSRAEAYCMQDEKQWADKPLFQIASMAQTRACAKSLRNILSWVVVLAGYRGTPAEELPREELHARASAAAAPSSPQRPSAAERALEWPADRTISVKQVARLIAIARQHHWSNEQLQARFKAIGITNAEQMSRTEYDKFCTDLTAGPPDDDDEAAF